METAFSLVGTGNNLKLLWNDEPVKVDALKDAGYLVKKSSANGGRGEYCYTCAPKGTGVLRIWYEVTIPCNGVLGAVWFCSHCGTAYEHQRRGNKLWSELQKTAKPSIEKSQTSHADQESYYLPTREDFETAYRRLAGCGEAVPVNAVLQEIGVMVEGGGRTLNPQWRAITERNIEMWAGR